MLGGIAVAMIFGVLILLATEPLARKYRRHRETDEQIIARRRREAMRIVNEAYEQDHPHWYN